MTNALSDVKHGLRVLLRTPLFTICTIAALAIGIGSTTALFSVVHALLIKPLPYENASRLVLLFEHFRDQHLDAIPVSPPEFLEYKAQLLLSGKCGRAVLPIPLKSTLKGHNRLPECYSRRSWST